MNTRTPIRNPWLSQPRTAFCLAILLLIINASCASVRPQPTVDTQPTANTQPTLQPTVRATEPPPTSSAIELTPSVSSPTTDEALIPAGWTTYTGRPCDYAISLPADMQIWDEEFYSRTFGFTPVNPDQMARNFVYVSVIMHESQGQDGEEIYNYDPRQADLLLHLQVGESETVTLVPDLAKYFTYQRLPDTNLSGYAAQTYENLQPWEFPEGTKEMRYYLSLDDCMLQIGGYLDTTQSNQPGAITEDLFNQIVTILRVIP
jgi:hypothetical protein